MRHIANQAIDALRSLEQSSSAEITKWKQVIPAFLQQFPHYTELVPEARTLTGAEQYYPKSAEAHCYPAWSEERGAV